MNEEDSLTLKKPNKWRETPNGYGGRAPRPMRLLLALTALSPPACWWEWSRRAAGRRVARYPRNPRNCAAPGAAASSLTGTALLAPCGACSPSRWASRGWAGAGIGAGRAVSPTPEAFGSCPHGTADTGPATLSAMRSRQSRHARGRLRRQRSRGSA